MFACEADLVNPYSYTKVTHIQSITQPIYISSKFWRLKCIALEAQLKGYNLDYTY